MGLTDRGTYIPGNETAGTSSSWFDNLSQGYDQAYRVDSLYGMEQEVADRWLDSVLKYEQVTGTSDGLRTDLTSLAAYAATVRGEEPSVWQRSFIDGEFKVGPKLQQKIDTFRRVNEGMKALGRPDIRSFESVLDEVVAMRQEVRQKSQQMSDTGGFLDSTGMFLGQLLGSLSTRDPLVVGTLGLGGFGKTIGGRIITEAAVQAGLAGATEEFGLNPVRHLLGEPEQSAWQAALGGAVLGGGLRAGGEGLSLVLRNRLAQGLPEVSLDFEDAQIRGMLNELPDNARMRAAESLYEDSVSFRKASPYGETTEGLLRFTEEVRDVARAMNGEPMTAVARVLPPLPFEFVEKQAYFQMVREQAPDLWGKMEEAKAAIAVLDGRAAGLETALDGRTLPDAVRLVDPEAAAKLDQLSAVVNDPKLPEPVRQAADLDAQAIILRVGEDRVAQALQNTEIGLRKALQRTGQQRKAANKKLRDATKAVEVRADEIKRLADAKTRLATGNIPAVLSYATPDRPFLGRALSSDAVKARREALDLSEELIPDKAMELSVPSVVREDGLYDIGTGSPLKGDFVVPVEGADGQTKLMTVREIFEDAAEDAKLEEAIRSCAL